MSPIAVETGAMTRASILLGRFIRACILVDLVGWAIVLGRPGDTFHLSHSYDLMAAWMTEDHWADACTAAALASLVGVVQVRRWLRLVTMMPVIAMQGAIAVSFGGGPVVGTGFGTHLAMLLIALALCPWEWWRG